jgi:hypothetical protein
MPSRSRWSAVWAGDRIKQGGEIASAPPICPRLCKRLDANPLAMRQRRETVEHPFGTMKARTGATHFLTKTLPKVAEMALSVLAYNLTRVMNIAGIKPLIAAIAA